MSQPDQIPTPQVATGPQGAGGKGPHLNTDPIDPTGGKGPHVAIKVQAAQPTDSMVPPSLQTPNIPSSQDTGAGDSNLAVGKSPH